MNYEDLVAKTSKVPLFGEDLLNTPDWTKSAMQLQLHRWTKTGRLIRLKRGIYTLPQDRRKISFSLPWLANALYSPSYLSLEYALSFYDLIPETVPVLTCVTRMKTASFSNELGRFTYRHLKKDFFFGFKTMKDEFHKSYLLATKEKALLDLAYLYRGWQTTRDFLEESIRLQQVESLSKKMLKEYAVLFRSKRVTDTVDTLLEMI